MAAMKDPFNVYVRDVKVAGPRPYGGGGGTDPSTMANVAQMLRAALDSPEYRWSYEESDLRIEEVDQDGKFVRNWRVPQSRDRPAQMAAGVKLALSLGLADGRRELIDSEADHRESVSPSIKGETVDPSSPVRIQLDFRADQIKELDELAKEAKLSTRKDLFNSALAMFQWAAKEKRAGRTVLALNEETGQQRVLVMPALEAFSDMKSREKPMPPNPLVPL